MKTRGDDNFNYASKREVFAALAMQGILEAGSYLNEQVARLAVQQADNLIEELNKDDSPQ